MTALSAIVDPAAIFLGSGLTAKHDVLEKAASIAAECYGLDRKEVAARLNDRESVGTTGFGGSVAIPHAKFANLDHCVGAVICLENPIEYNSHDGRPVDLVFALFSPENAGVLHLKALAEISRLLRDENLVSKLRGADNKAAIYALVAGQHEQQAA